MYYFTARALFKWLLHFHLKKKNFGTHFTFSERTFSPLITKMRCHTVSWNHLQGKVFIVTCHQCDASYKSLSMSFNSPWFLLDTFEQDRGVGIHKAPFWFCPFLLPALPIYNYCENRLWANKELQGISKENS